MTSSIAAESHIAGGTEPYAPVILFAYNRPSHTRRTLEALQANPLAAHSRLYVFSDGAREDLGDGDVVKVRDVREVLRSRQWCKDVVVQEREGNFGLAASIRGGVEEILRRHGRAIVLEDDIVTSPGFLDYMNDALRVHSGNERVMHITGYLPETSYRRFLPDTFLARYMSCWGWATWSRAWSRARWDAAELLRELDSKPGGRREFDLGGGADFSHQLEANLRGEMNTWAVFWGASIYLADGLCLFPGQSMVCNIGMDGSGVHFSADTSSRYDVVLAQGAPPARATSSESLRGRMYLRSFFAYGRNSGFSARALRLGGRLRASLARRLRGPPTA